MELVYILVGLFLIAAGILLFKYEINKFKKSNAPFFLKIIERLIFLEIIVAIIMVGLGFMALIQGVKTLIS